MNAIELQCRQNWPHYKLLDETSLNQMNTFSSMLFWNDDRRKIIHSENLHVYEINLEIDFEQLKRAKESESGEKVSIVEFYHGPLFQDEYNVCEFDVAQKRCRGHNGEMVLTKSEPFYINMKGIGANPNMRRMGYVLWGKALVRRVYQRDPQDSTDINQHFRTNDLIYDYGNNKFLKCNEEFYPTHIIFYQRNGNPRLDLPNYQPYFTKLMNPLPPSHSYEDVPLAEEFLEDVFQCSEFHRDIQPISVQKITNPFLEEIFNEVRRNYGPGNEVEVIRVFHGVPFENADAVARFNLDWRKALYGKYGWGIHFGRYPHNAKYFPHKYPRSYNRKRCMIAFDMLARHSVELTFDNIHSQLTNLYLPPENFDTVEVPRTGSFIKFNDHEFIPRFKIIYTDFWGDDSNDII